jgi:hypothetical protein
MDLGDLIFFVVFVIIIISNIVKQVKKAERASGKEPPDKPAKKKSGWKNVLEEMLEDARQQMAEKQPPEPAEAPAGRSAGWDDIISEKMPPRREPEKKPEKRPEIRQSKRPRQASLMRKDAVQQKKPAFHPECMRCNASMKDIPDLGIPDQSGLVYCDACGEQHQYRIVDGELKLQRTHAKRKSVLPAERTYEKPLPIPGMGHEVPLSVIENSEKDVSDKGIHRRLDRKGLKNAVVWAEILGKPVGLRDLEI